MALLDLAACLLHAQSRAAEGKFAVGSKSPPLELKTIDGKVIQIHRQPGKVVLLDFMTTSCPSCKQASTSIQLLYQELGANGFLPVAIALDPEAPNILPLYRNLYKLTFPVGALPREDVIRYLSHPEDKPMYVPTLVLLDKQGRISAKHVGWIGEQELRSAVTRLLNQKA